MDPIGKPSGKYSQPPAIHINGPAVIDLSGPPPEAPTASPALPEPQMLRKPDLPAQPVTAAQAVPQPALSGKSSVPDLNILDNPKIGSKVTVCVLCYGNFHDLHRRCLNSIVATVPSHRLDLRIATNEACLDTINYIHQLPTTKLYISAKNRFKYPAMREMFTDKECPITTKYVAWFDDDSYVRQPNWLQILAEVIVNQPDDVAMYGVRMFHQLTVDPRRGIDHTTWFKNAPWYHNRPFRTKQGAESPNGNIIHFIVGGFWALNVEAMRTCDIPDKRIMNNGDIAIGEQLWQNGYKTKQFNTDKVFIHTSANPRRGVTHKFPWQL